MDKETNEKQNKTKAAQMTKGQANLFTQQILTECLWNAKFCAGDLIVN